MIMNFLVPKQAENTLIIFARVIFSIMALFHAVNLYTETLTKVVNELIKIHHFIVAFRYDKFPFIKYCIFSS
jgi:hypothetical protein